VQSYAVTWRKSQGLLYSGRLLLDTGHLRLEGSSTAGRSTTEGLRYADITSVYVGRGPQERINERPVLVLGRRNGAPLRITSLAGIGTLLEIESHLAERRTDLPFQRA
jgi:hypothetical protein